jgi:site-specific DNA recombinase
MSPEAKGTVHCAIYTRKSSEEGLEQPFNSLDAQREACEAYISSQRHEGWKMLSNRYDDGGYSGGSMERPALKRLLQDIEASKVNVIVVYKVDRLTRSLADFAKIVEALDAKGVSFVSVTQQFNTTTSMGRLTLNILLSFAQFEREVTGERIRDKIAASKRKGMWMGGMIPLGYDLEGRKLVPNPKEAQLVSKIFSLYLQLGCVSKLAKQLDREKIRSKVWVTRTGTRLGGVPFARGALYDLLRNRLYIGEIRHREKWYPGEQKGIVSLELWQKVQAQLESNLTTRRKRARDQASSLLSCKSLPRYEVQHLERIFRGGLGVLVVRYKPTTEVGGEHLGGLEMCPSEAGLTATRRSDQNNQGEFRDRYVHRLKTPICVGAPTLGSSSPTGRNRTVYPKRSEMRPDHCWNCSRVHSNR